MRKVILKLLVNAGGWFLSNIKMIGILAGAIALTTVSYKYGSYQVQRKFDLYVQKQYENLNEIRASYDKQIKEISAESNRRYSDLQKSNQKNADLVYKLRNAGGLCHESTKAGNESVPDSKTARSMDTASSKTRSDDRLQQNIRSLRSKLETQREALKQCVAAYSRFTD